jgi:hypothetical protein
MEEDKMKIRVTECKRDGRKWTGRKLSAIIRRIGGRNAFFWQDSGLGRDYGQIMVPVAQRLGGGNSAVTGRVSISEWNEKLNAWASPSDAVFQSIE